MHAPNGIKAGGDKGWTDMARGVGGLRVRRDMAENQAVKSNVRAVAVTTPTVQVRFFELGSN